MKKELLIIFLLLFYLLQSNAQSVGLVLSGGGAKGLAHIEVIRVLEENNIPIDYIAGTSIGGIVGGLYAAGFSPDEMEEMFRSDDFYFWSTGKIQREYRYYFKRPEPDPSWIQLNIERKKNRLKVLPPTNIIPPEQMDFAYMELTAASNAACNYDFNQLMIPFFCVSADVKKSSPVILRKGDLGNAIRSSMTVPFYFKPIEIDGALLFDGGLINNFPTDYMKEIFNPDIIIGHKVADGERTGDMDDIMGQISNMVMRPTNFEIKAEDGILLETHFDDVSLLDFDKIDDILSKGRTTINNAIDSIRNIVPRRISKEKVESLRYAFNSKKPDLFFQNIQVEGIKDPMQRRFIIQSIKHNNNVIPLADLKKEYFKLVADEHLTSIQPLARYNKETGFFDLHLKVQPAKKFEVNFGGNLSTKPINQGFAGFNYRNYNSRAYTISSNLYFGRFYSSFKLGGRIDYPTQLPFYLASYVTLNRWDFFSSSSELFFEDVRPPYIIQDEISLRTEIGFPLGLHNKFNFGVCYSTSGNDYYQTETFKKEDEPDQTKFRAVIFSSGIDNNSLNYKQYATEGAKRAVEAKYVIGEEIHTPGTTSSANLRSTSSHSFYQLKAYAIKYFNFGKRFTLGTHVEGLLSNKNAFQNYRASQLSAPAFQPTPHSKSLFIDHFHANNYAAGGLKSIFNFTPDMHLRVEAYSFLPLKEFQNNNDMSGENSDFFIKNVYWQGMASLVHQTGVGPLSLSVNYYDKPNTKWYLTLNFGYILFNKRGL